MKKQKSSKKRFTKILIIVGAMICASYFLALTYTNFKQGKINFKINNIELDDTLKISDIKEYIESTQEVYIGTCNITKSITFEADTSEIDSITFLEYLRLNNKNIDIQVEIIDINKDILKDIMVEFNSTHIESKDAYILIDYNGYKVISEEYGVTMDTNRVVADINTENVEQIDPDEYIIKPKILKEDLQGIVDEANKYVNWTVTYNRGQKFVCGIEHVNIVDNNTRVEVDNSFIKDIVKELETVYDTAGKGFLFTDRNGNELEIMGGTYGDIMDSAQEREYLTNLFETATSEYNRQPIMKQELPKEIGDTYIEISIEEQHLWFFKDEEIVSETDVVTGDSLRGRDTPKGVYFISEMINGKYLTGDTYRTWVNKWMRLTNSGIGLHDAGWRGSFGGTIYKSNGSHGCINLPKKYAYELYEQVTKKMPVIVY